MGVLRFSGSIGHIQVQILIDGGSSDSFFAAKNRKVSQITC